MTQHKDKEGHALKIGDLVHFTIDGKPYTGIVHALVRRDHEPAILTLVQLFLPVKEVTKDMPKQEDAKKDRVDPNQEKQQEPKETKHQDKPKQKVPDNWEEENSRWDDRPEDWDDSPEPKVTKHQDAGDEKPRDSHDHRTEPKETTPQGEKNSDDPPSSARHQSEATAHSNQQQPKPTDANRGSTLAEPPKKGSKPGQADYIDPLAGAGPQLKSWANSDDKTKKGSK